MHVLALGIRWMPLVKRIVEVVFSGEFVIACMLEEH